jgi:uncharacterized Zn-binding protein involved in type VI secretion
MAAIALEDCLSKGHDDESWPKTLPESGLSSKTKVNGKYVVLTDLTKYALHIKGSTTHTANMRKVNSGSSKAKIEGYPIARINDTLADGDSIAQGYSKVNVGG